jgi:hypothetical protein
MIDVDHVWIYKRIVMPLDCCLCYKNIGIVAWWPVEKTLGGSTVWEKMYCISGTMSDTTHWLCRLVDIRRRQRQTTPVQLNLPRKSSVGSPGV